MNRPLRHRAALIVAGYAATVLVLGALLAPWFFAGGKWFLALAATHGWRDSALIGWIVRAAETTELPGYFDRAALVVALLGLWPLARLLRLTRAETVGDERWPVALQNLAIGLALAAAIILVLGAGFTMLGVCSLKKKAILWSIAPPLVSGLCVGCVEELLFRGVVLGVLRRSLGARAAVLLTTGIFAFLHFLKPPAHGAIADDAVTWTSGFRVVAQLLDGFGEWQNVVAEFLLLFAVGWVLAGARVATGGLGLGIGLHAGWVAAMKYFSQITTPAAALRRGEFFPWVSENHCKAIVGSYVGLAPVAVILATGALALWICKPRPRA